MTRRLAVLAAPLLAAVPMAGFAAPAPQTPEQIVNHHLTAAGAGDANAVARDYADDAVLIMPDNTYKGRPAIRSVFEQLLAKKAPPLVVKRKVFEGDVGYLTWSMNAGKPGEVDGSDTFVVQNGKIVAQTVMMVPDSGNTPPAPIGPATPIPVPAVNK